MSNSGLGYSVLDPRSTFTTYLAAGKIMGHKVDAVSRVEADSDTYIIGIWSNQTDDFIDQVNQWVTGNAKAPGPVEIEDNLWLDAPSPTNTAGDQTGSPEFISDKSDAGIGRYSFFRLGNRNWSWSQEANDDLYLNRYDTSGVFQSQDRIEAANGNWTLANDLTLDGAPLATFGTGTGAVRHDYIKADGSSTQIFLWNISTTPSLGAYQWLHYLDEVLRLYRHDGSDYRELFSLPSDTFVTFLGGAQGASAFNYGNSGVPASVTHTNYVGAAGVARWAVHDGTSAYDGGFQYDTNSNLLSITAGNAAQIYILDGAVRPVLDDDVNNGLTGSRWASVFAYAATFTNTLTLDADTGLVNIHFTDTASGDARIRYDIGANRLAFLLGGTNEMLRLNTSEGIVGYYNFTLDFGSPVATLGDNTGSPTLSFLKADAGTSFILFGNIDATPSAGDASINHTSNEGLRFNAHDGVAYRSTIEILNDSDIRFFVAAQGVGTTYWGNASQGVWTYEGLSGGDVTHIYGKDAGGITDIRFRSVFNAATSGDFIIKHDASNNWYLNRYDGIGERQIFGVTDDTSLALLAGAQGTANVIVGPTGTFQTTVDFGRYTQSVVHRYRKADGNITVVQFLNISDTLSDGDFQMAHHTNEAWEFQRHDGGAWRNILSTANDTNLTLLSGAQGGIAVVTVGNSSNSAAAIVGAFGGDSVLQFRKAPASSTLIDFLAVNGNLNSGDYRISHSSIENWSLSRHDGTTTRTVILVTDDTALDLLSGAQGAGVVGIGSSGNNATLIVGKSGGNSFLQIRKADASEGAVSFLNADIERWRLSFASDEVLYMQEYNSSGVFVRNSFSVASNFFQFNTAIVSLADPSVILRLGDGTGNPERTMTKSASGVAVDLWAVGGTDEFRTILDANERYSFQVWTGSWQDVWYVNDGELDVYYLGNIEAEGQIYSPEEPHAPTGTTETIDWDEGNVHLVDLDAATGNVTLTLNNPNPGGVYFIVVRQVTSGFTRNLIWPASVTWPGGTAPTISTGTNDVDLIRLVYSAADNEYLATFSQDFS